MTISEERLAEYRVDPEGAVRKTLDEWDEEYRRIKDALPDEDLWEMFTEQCRITPWKRS